MIGIKIDVPLLRKQRNFLLEYPWQDGQDKHPQRQGKVIMPNWVQPPEEVDGIINLLDHILDIEEGYAKILDNA